MMSLSMVPQMQLICPLCKTNAGNDDDHDPACPKARIKVAVAENPVWSCQKCDGSVELTMDDYLECRKCRRIYTTGYVAMGYNPDLLPETFLRQTAPVDKCDTYTKVLLLPVRSKRRRFRLDHILKLIRSDTADWKARRR